MNTSLETTMEGIRGRICDADSHEMVPTGLWRQEFGEVPDEIMSQMQPQDSPNNVVSDLDGDYTEVSLETANMKGIKAPGAIDMTKRLSLLDLVGIDKQFLYPTGVGILGAVFGNTPTEALMGSQLAAKYFPDGKVTFDIREAGQRMMSLHNDWCIRTRALSPSRLFPVAMLAVDSLDDMLAETRRVAASGITAVSLPSSVPPAGMSPADPAMDEFWSLICELDVTLAFHIQGEYGFTASTAWSDIDLFRHGVDVSDEIPLNAFHMSTVHFGIQTYLSAMILGGVLDRFPRLRIGAIELGAHWFGPLSENLTMWSGQLSSHLNLQRSPEEYLRDQVRVTPWFFEPVDKFIDRYGLEDCYCYGSDFPHLEGGTDPLGKHAARLERFGDEVLEKFFVSNAGLLFESHEG